MIPTPLSTPSQTLQGILCGAGAGALWGLVFLAPELVREFSPLYLTFGRYLFFGVFSGLLLAKRRRTIYQNLTIKHWKSLLGLALIGNILYYALLSTAVHLGGIALTSLVIGFLPVAVTIIGSREKNAVGLKKLTPSLVLCAAGTVCVGQQAFSLPVSATQSPLIGLLCAVGALLSWTWFAVANSRWIRRVRGISASEWNLLTGVVTGALTLVSLPVLVVFQNSGHSGSQWIKLIAVSAGVAFFASIIGNALWNRMNSLLPLTLVGQMILFETLFALLYGFLWESRGPSFLEACSFVLVSLSVVTCLAAHQTQTHSAEAA